MKATYLDLWEYLQTLVENNDQRLQDTITVYDSTLGEYFPAEFVEYNGDDILDNGHIFLMTQDWNV